jgi:peptidoglycan L-alanyl-D-glutamate endopeptidase CwlK
MALANISSDAAYQAQVATLRENDLDCLAPKFRERLEAALEECNARGFDTIHFETCRSDELARLYFAHGASKSPDALHTWHHYGLAADIISKSREWDVYPGQDGTGGDVTWYKPVEDIFKAHGMDWGGDWKSFRDWPHWQFGGISASPHDAPTILAEHGLQAVWQAVNAI